MGRHSDRLDDPELLRQKLIGLGERSLRKSYYPQLQSRMLELERFRALLDHSKDAIFLINATNLTVADANRTTGNMLGISSANLTGRDIRELLEFDPNSSFGEFLKAAPSREYGLAEGICQFITSEGTRIPVEFTAQKDLFADQSYIVFVGRDISERLQAEKEKEKIQEQLRHAQKMEAIGVLSGGIAHDFNNILAVIMGFAEIAKDQARGGKADSGSLAEIMGAAERARQLVQQIMTFSRKQDPDFKVLDLNKVIQDTVALLKRTLPKMINIQTKLEREPAPILADATQLEQVLLNLSANAVDAMPQGGRLTIEIDQVHQERNNQFKNLDVNPGTYVALMISDTGQGMSEATRERIFDPFYTTKDVGKGTGLGLSTVYGIIKAHGGTIYCESRSGRGTNFRILLPLYRGKASAVGGEHDLASLDLMQGNETILLVDDEKGLLHLGILTLQGAGYRVLTASSGEEALDVISRRQQPPDLVVMDLGMPGMGGHAAMKAIFKINPKIKVIIASGYLSESKPQEALEDGASGFVAKPFTRTELLEAVRNVLDEK